MNYLIKEEIDGKFQHTYNVQVIETNTQTKFILKSGDHESWSPEYRNEIRLTVVVKDDQIKIEKPIQTMDYGGIVEVINLLQVVVNHNAPAYKSKIVKEIVV